MPLDKNILKKKVAGIPVPILAAGGGIVAIVLFRKFGKSPAASTDDASTDSGATPSDYSAGAASTGAASDYSGGSTDGGGAGGGSSYGGGGGSYDGSIAGSGGAFVPMTDAGSSTPQVIKNFTKIIRPVRPRTRPLVVNRIRIVNGNTPFKPRPPHNVRQTPPIGRPVVRRTPAPRPPRPVIRPVPHPTTFRR